MSARAEPARLYLELLKKALAYDLWPEPLVPSEFHDAGRPPWKRLLYRAARRLLRRWDITLMQPRFVNPREHAEGIVLGPVYAHTMIGRKRLDNLQVCVETALAEAVPGDLIETGVWRGGACILMRGVLAAHGVADRRVFVADSFRGLPPPDTGRSLPDARRHWPRGRG